MTESKSRSIKVDYLTRVEGEGSLFIDLSNNQVNAVHLKIFEPPRFFEALLRGRGFAEAPDITARICGICPVAYQMSSVQALENAFGISIDSQTSEMRRLLYCGEWIASHTLHIYMLHAPDFLGFANIIEMAKSERKLVERGLALKQAGNEIMQCLGGREIHPINVKVGGFYKLPSYQELQQLREKLLTAADLARATVNWAGTLNFPDCNQNYTFVALQNSQQYPMNHGTITSSAGLRINADKFTDHFEEFQVPYSNALQCVMKKNGENYLVGPLARYSLNFTQLPNEIQAAAKTCGVDNICSNPYQSIIIRSLEVLYAVTEAIRIIDKHSSEQVDLEPAGKTSAADRPQAIRGYAATEAPRGLLYHHYVVDQEGYIKDAKIIPPTSQNQGQIEADLRSSISTRLNLSDSDLQDFAERTIRNYDPCISCATHFLKLTVCRSNFNQEPKLLGNAPI